MDVTVTNVKLHLLSDPSMDTVDSSLVFIEVIALRYELLAHPLRIFFSLFSLSLRNANPGPS